MWFRLPVFSAHSNHPSLTSLFVSYRKTVETETFFFTNIVCAADNTTVINHLSCRCLNFQQKYNSVNLQADCAAV